MSLGIKLRSMRKDKHLSGTKLAAQVGVSRSLISQIERGVVTPSIDVLRRLAAALEVPVGDFFNDSSDSSHLMRTDGVSVIHEDERFKLNLPKSNLTYELGTPLPIRSLQAIFTILGPCMSETDKREPFTHAGEEVNFVIEGELTVMVDGKEYILKQGGCIYFNCALPHLLINKSDKRTVVFSVTVPAAY